MHINSINKRSVITTEWKIRRLQSSNLNTLTSLSTTVQQLTFPFRDFKCFPEIMMCKKGVNTVTDNTTINIINNYTLSALVPHWSPCSFAMAKVTGLIPIRAHPVSGIANHTG